MQRNGTKDNLVMQIPKKVKVGGIRYTVKIVDEHDIDSEAAALIEVEKCQIKILKGNPQFMGRVFLHEVIHAMNMELTEERVEFLAQAFYQLIADNPKIFEGGEERHDNSN